MYVNSVHIKDLRCFEEALLCFVNPDESPDVLGPANVTLILGNNGVGKTTVLRAIVLGVLSFALQQAGYVPYSMVRRAKARRQPDSARVSAEFWAHPQDMQGNLSEPDARGQLFRGSLAISTRGDAEWISNAEIGHPRAAKQWIDLAFLDDSPSTLVLGYGASRRVEPASEFSPRQRRKLRLLRYERVSSLFEEQVALVPLAAWLPELERTRPNLYERVCTLINQLVPQDTRFTGERDGDEYSFERGGVKVGFAALSDGYRGYIGLLGDMFYHLCTGLTDSDDPRDSRGIVLVDEIGLHLHPAWQRVVVPTLAKTLPKLQFVLTTHSPIIAGTVYAQNIRLLEADANGISHLEPLDEEIHGLNADQILLTEAFGLPSSRAPDFAARFDELVRGLDPEEWKDSLRLMRMFNRGSAGENDSLELPSAPEWASKAASELAAFGLGTAAEDAPTRVKKKRVSKNKSASKKKPANKTKP